ncbi:MAG: hypothetical protein KME26_31645 [Oscillatoria princeps RMCB-10]|jgi:hypothetical protein|nr:hypothetical protein [Oscillatoria princeps RMCB-10]
MSEFQVSAELVKQKIKEAFYGVEFPGDEHLLNPKSFDDSEIEDFKGKGWKLWENIPGEIIKYNYCSLPFFSPEAFLFVLPAYMIYALDNPQSNVSDFTVYSLTDTSDKSEIREIFASRVSLFTEIQKEAIALFLEYEADQYDYRRYPSNPASKALQSYWSKK